MYKKRKQRQPQEETRLYRVEAVVGKRVTVEGKTEYLLKWEGFEERASSWEPENFLTEDLVNEWTLNCGPILPSLPPPPPPRIPQKPRKRNLVKPAPPSPLVHVKDQPQGDDPRKSSPFYAAFFPSSIPSMAPSYLQKTRTSTPISIPIPSWDSLALPLLPVNLFFCGHSHSWLRDSKSLSLKGPPLSRGVGRPKGSKNIFSGVKKRITVKKDPVSTNEKQAKKVVKSEKKSQVRIMSRSERKRLRDKRVAEMKNQRKGHPAIRGRERPSLRGNESHVLASVGNSKKMPVTGIKVEPKLSPIKELIETNAGLRRSERVGENRNPNPCLSF